VLLWGSIWGLTGMVLAVPLTAAIRIYLERLSHPLPRWVANTLAGKGDDDDDAAQVKPL
jgi:AI-2 transport protein TqsA